MVNVFADNKIMLKRLTCNTYFTLLPAWKSVGAYVILYPSLKAVQMSDGTINSYKKCWAATI